MAFTKVVGAGIHTLSNVHTHNINSSGIITATKFVGPIEGDITAVDATFTGNVSIAKTLTYEDVKNVDSVGIGTFREGIFIPDNKKAQFGNVAGTADFEIAHDTNNTVLQNRTGALYLKGIGGSGNNIIIEAKNNDNSARFIPDGAVELYHSGNQKIQTTSHGISVTGIGTFSDAVRIVKTSGPLLELTTNTGAADATLRLSEGTPGSTTNGGGMFYSGADNKLYITCGTDLTTKRITINRDDGRVGMGTAIPDAPLHILSDANNMLQIESTDRHSTLYLIDTIGSSFIQNDSGELRFGVGGGASAAGGETEAVRIDSTGRVGIGTDNPSALLHLNSTNPVIRLTDYDTSGPLHCDIESASGDLYLDTGSVHRDVIITSAGKANEIARFTGDGFIGIGSAAPTERLVVQGNGISNLTYDQDGGGFDGTSGGALVLTGIFDYSGSKLGLMVDNAGQGRIMNKTGQNLHLGTGNSKDLTITNIGSVGIGTDIVPQKFAVKGATDILHYPNTTIGNDRLQIGFNAPEGYIKAKNSTGSPASNLAFYTTDTSGNTNKRLHLSYNGRILTNGETAVNEVSEGGIHIKTASDGANTQALILENHGSSTDTTVTLKLVPSTSTPNDRYNSIKAINVDGQNKFDTVFHTCPGGTPLEAMRIDNQQRVIIGTQHSDTRHEVGHAALQVSGTGPNDSGIAVGRWSNNNQPAFLELSKSRATSITGHTAVVADDILGQVQFSGSDGTRYLGAAFIKGIATNPIADYDVAGYLSFGTNYGTTSPTERLRIRSTGEVTLGQVDSSSSSALHIRSVTSTETTLELSTKDNYNGTYPSAKISFTQQNGTEIARIKCDTNTGAANQADLLFWTNYGGLYERMRITKTGPVIIHSGSNSAGSLRIGGNYDSTGTTNSTAKLGTLMMPHYTNAEEPIQMIRGYSDSAQTLVSIGGGTSSANAATNIRLYTSNSITGTGAERMIITSKGDLNIKSNDKGWVTIEHGYNGRGMKRHYREFNTGSSAATYNLIRVRRHYWGWGHYKFTVKRVYYSGIMDSVFYLNGHGRDDGSYNPSYTITEYQHNSHGSNVQSSGRITHTTPSGSSPGDVYANYVDVQLQCPAYMYLIVEVEAAASNQEADISNLASDQYALHP